MIDSVNVPSHDLSTDRFRKATGVKFVDEERKRKNCIWNVAEADRRSSASRTKVEKKVCTRTSADSAFTRRREPRCRCP